MAFETEEEMVIIPGKMFQKADWNDYWKQVCRFPGGLGIVGRCVLKAGPEKGKMNIDLAFLLAIEIDKASGIESDPYLVKQVERITNEL